MGEIAAMMLDGTLCEGCGAYLEGDAAGFPRRCDDCAREVRFELGTPRTGRVKCAHC